MIDICDHPIYKTRNPYTGEWQEDEWTKLNPGKLNEAIQLIDQRLSLLEEKCLTEEDYEIDPKTLALQNVLGICDDYLRHTDDDIYYRDDDNLDDIFEARRYVRAMVKELKYGLR